jgi:hypothetical protein
LVKAVNPDGGNMNCGLVACQVDAALAGDKPNAVDSADAPLTREEMEAMTGRTWKQVQGLSGVVSYLKKSGPGARAIIGAWPKTGTGHYFNAINDDGQTVLIDGQIGKAWHADVWRYYYVMGMG